jgi:hypothetical protein
MLGSCKLEPHNYKIKSGSSLQEWGKVPTANAYADGQMSVPSA